MIPENWKFVDNETLRSICENILKKNSKEITKQILRRVLNFTKKVSSPLCVKGVIVCENFKTCEEEEEEDGVIVLYTCIEDLEGVDQSQWLKYTDFVLRNVIRMSQCIPLPILFVNTYYFSKHFISGDNIIKFLDKKWFLKYINK